MVQDIVDFLWGESGINRTNNRIGGGDGKMGLEHGRDVGRNNSHNIAASDGELVLEGVGKREDTTVELGIGVSAVGDAMDDSDLLGVDGCGAGEEVDGVEF